MQIMSSPLALPMLAVTALALTGCVSGCSSGCSTCSGERSAGPDRSDGRIPEVKVTRVARGAITVDGRLDEAAWKRAGRTGPFVHPQSGKAVPGSPVRARARLAWDDQHLYVGAVVRDAEPTSPFSRDQPDPHIWAKASGVELMLQPGDPGDNRHYYEIQVDVAEAVWDTRFEGYNRPRRRRRRGGGLRFGHERWQSGLRRAVTVQPRRGRYVVELALPWSALAPAARRRPGLAIPPRPGDVWRMNLYSFRDGQRAALAWSPILGQGNFHRASRFGRARFGVP
jgi:hypothetical protein